MTLSDKKRSENARATVALMTYNHESFIEQSLTTVLEQDYENLQIIVWDNCSTDRNRDIIDRVLSGYDGPHDVRVHKSEENYFPGFYPVNTVTEWAQGDYVLLASGDDYMRPDRVSQTVAAFQKTGAGAVACSTNDIDQNGDPLGIRNRLDDRAGFSEFSTAADFIRLKGSPVAYGPGLAYSRSAYRFFGPLREGPRNADVNIAFRGALMGGNFYIRKPLVFRRLHRDNIDFRQGSKSVATSDEQLLYQERVRANRIACLMTMREDLKTLNKSRSWLRKGRAMQKAMDEWVIYATQRWVDLRYEMMMKSIGIV